MRQRRTIAVRFAMLAAAGAFAVAGGCSKDNRADSWRWNPSPAEMTLQQRDEDIANRIAVTNDENLRQFNSDLGRLFLLDRPSRMSPEPSPW
ncbi:MAG: hypothetical protein IBJ11_09945 [Phycisphaerales bacterium]|nr:hypothetical protein [Phycisphaerales bacterium]